MTPQVTANFMTLPGPRARHREQQLGIPADPRRTAQTRPPGQHVHDPPDPQDAADPASSQAAHRYDPAAVPALQAATSLAADFFHADCALTLQRPYCLFVIGAGSRCGHILGVTAHPDGLRTTQQIRHLLMDGDDRAANFGSWFATAPGRSPDRSTRTWPVPVSRPRRSRLEAPANAYAERFVLTARTEVTDRCSSSANDTCGWSWPSSRRTTTDGAPSQPPAPPAPAGPPRRRPPPEADQAPTRPRRAHQRIQASRVEAQVKSGSRVLEPSRPRAVCNWSQVQVGGH